MCGYVCIQLGIYEYVCETANMHICVRNNIPGVETALTGAIGEQEMAIPGPKPSPRGSN